MKTKQPATPKKNLISLFSLLFTILAATILLSTGNALAWEAPIGIPQPWVEPDLHSPSPPNSWNSELAGYYYIDNSKSCTDSGNTYGYPASPRCTFPSTFPAGSYVEIHGGPYTGGTTYLTFNGSKNAPVWFRGSPDDTPEIQKNFVIKGTYAFVEHLNFTGNHTISIRPHNNIKTDHIVIRHVVILGTGTNVGNNTGLAVRGDSGIETNDIILFGNTISYCGDSETDTENDFHGFNAGSYVHNIWIIDNTTHHNGGDGVQLSHNGVQAHHIYIGRNIFHDEGENSIDIKKANDVIVSQNICYNIEPRSSSPGEVIVIHYDPDNIWILFNTVYNGDIGIITTGSTNTWFIGNIIYNIHHTNNWDPDSGYSHGAAIHFRGDSSGGVLYNTLYNYDTGLQLTSGNTSYIVENNIFAGRAEPTGYDVRVANTSIANITKLSHNLLYTDGSSRTYWHGTTYTVSGLQGIGKCTGCLEENPQFVNSNSNNFRILSNSNAKGNASASEVLDDFYNRYRVSIKKDATGLYRPQGSTFDIGAYEYDEGYVPPPPSGGLNPPADFSLIQ